MVTTQAAGEIGDLHVFGGLLKRGATPYVPLVDDGVDALVRIPTGQIIELQIRSGGSAGGVGFRINKITPKKNLFIVGVEFADQEPVNVWIFPSSVFDQYANNPPRGAPRDLDLDTGSRKYGMPLKDLLCGFRNRWELITDYERYEALLESAEDLEDVLAMKESLESPEEEALNLL